MIAKTYHLAPSEDYPPDSVISLGRIWTSPTDPMTSLFRLASEAPPFPEDMPVQKPWKKGWTYDEQNTRTRAIGILAKFLETVIKIDINVGASWTSKKGRHYKIEKAETEWVVPTDEYIAQAVAQPSVEKFIIESDFQKSLYMVIGVKIARGAAASQEASQEQELGLSAQADATAAGAPGVSTGPNLIAKSGGRQNTSFEESSDFVFAYRLRKIYYEKYELKSKPYNKGAALQGLKERSKGLPDAVKQEFTSAVKVSGLAKEDAGAGKTGLKTEEIVDDDEENECIVVLPSG